MIARFAFASLLVGGVQCQSPFSLSGYIAEDFFDRNRGVEASGLDIAPDGSHLVAVGDNGHVMFLNLEDDYGHCMLDLSDDVYGTDFEGVAIDPTSWTRDAMHAHIVHEGADDDEPYLYKIKYDFDPGNGVRCRANVVDSKSLHGAIPRLRTSNGIESLGLKTPSSGTAPAVFFVGIQDTGKVYEVTSEGSSNGPCCYDGGVGEDDISASTYNRERNHLWTRVESQDAIAVIDAANDCPLAMYDLGYGSDDEEGIAFDWANGRMYLAIDGQGDGSYIGVYDFTYPDLGECMGDSQGSCSPMDVCRDAPPSVDFVDTPPLTQGEAQLTQDEVNPGAGEPLFGAAINANEDGEGANEDNTSVPTYYPTHVPTYTSNDDEPKRMFKKRVRGNATPRKDTSSRSK